MAIGPVTNLSAPGFDLLLDGISHLASLAQDLVRAAFEAGRIGEAPMEAGGYAGKNRASLCTGFIADGNNVREHLSGFEDVENGLGFLSGDIDSDFIHHADNVLIQRAGFQSGALSFKMLGADLIEEGLGHLTAGAVMNTDEQDFRFHGFEDFFCVAGADFDAWTSRLVM